MSESKTQPQRSPNETRPLSSRRMLLQLGVFLVGFLSLLALHGLFTYLIQELNEQTANERARLFVGEQIVADIRLVESGVYRMATTLGVLGQQRVGREISELIEHIRYNLRVLRDGGVARQLIRLNLEKRDHMIKEVPYDPSLQLQQGYILEIIDLTPKLNEIEAKIEELLGMLEERESYRRSADSANLFSLERRIKIFLKKLPPIFIRLTENANRMFFDSHQRLEAIEERIAEQTHRYRVVELVIVVGIIVSVMLLGLKFARQIERGNKQLAEARDRMRAAKEEAERANRAKSEFLSRMSHELRTPLNAVLGFSQLLAIDPHLSEDQKDGLLEIDKAGRHLLELINEILDLAKIEAGRLELEQIEFSLAEVADEVLGIMAARAHDKGLELFAFVSPSLPGLYRGDPTRVKQVLLNLLGNAVKFTERGEVGLHIEPDAENGIIRFDVTDTGIGFDADTRKRLFQPFTQADESTTRQFGGSGLGLVICKELIEAMGGRIDTESAPGKGSTFWFHLPFDKATQADSAERETFPGLRVLLAVERPAVRRSLGAYLQAFHVETTTIDDVEVVESALKTLDAADRSYSLVMVDCDLGDQGADQLARRLSGRETLCLLTNSNTARTEAVASYRYNLSKPITSRKLADLLHQVVDQRVRTPLAADVTATATATTRVDASGLEVLLVEDQLPNQLVARSMLRHLGVQARCVDNGQAALDALREDEFDLVFMDVQMPVMDGLEAVRRIRRQEAEQALHHITVVAMTANAMEADRDACLDAGMDDHLPKPISLETLAEKLERWVPGFTAPEKKTG